MNYSFENYRLRDRLLMRMGLHSIVNLINKTKTSINKVRYKKKNYRKLEIGPGLQRLAGFETLNIIDGKSVDYIMDISNPLKFEDNSFDLIYASHVIEHVPWFLQKRLFSELFRILKPSGVLEIWVPNFSKVIKVFNDFEGQGINNTHLDGWYRFNEEKDVCTWVNGRIFTYGDGTANPMSFNWHRCVYSENYLNKLFIDAGFSSIKKMDNSEVRGYDHGWINLGYKGTKV
ncbi:MAG: methyltransferase domain-containing protein [Treponema sp.]|nr:methyltransferase domain-containing protein [Treponema sp.]